MLTLPKRIIHMLRHFEPILSERVWEWAKVLVIGAILAPGERTVAAILRVMGCADEKQFQNYHRVLNRAVLQKLIAEHNEHGASLSVQFRQLLQTGGRSTRPAL